MTIKPFRVLTGLGRAYVVNLKTSEVIACYILREPAEDEPSEEDSPAPGLVQAKKMCKRLNNPYEAE